MHTVCFLDEALRLGDLDGLLTELQVDPASVRTGGALTLLRSLKGLLR